MKRSLLFLLTVVLWAMTAHAQHPVTTIRLDPDNQLGGTVGDFFERVEVIPLETTPRSLFGRMAHMEVTQDYFIIHDGETNAVLIFQRDGRFHAKIVRRKEREYIGHFALDRTTNEILVSVVGHLILFYDYEGRMLREQKTDIDADRMFAFGHGLYALHPHVSSKIPKNSDISHDLVFTRDFRENLKDMLPYDKKYRFNDYVSSSLFSSQGDGTFCFSFPYSYNIFAVDSNGISQEYRFIFPEKYSLPLGFSSSPEYLNKRKEYVYNSVARDFDRIIRMAPFYRHGEWLLFHAKNIGYISNTIDLMYSTKTGMLYATALILGDSVSNYLPILQARNSQNMVALYGGALYTSMPARTYVRMLDQLKEAGKPVASLPEVGRKDNPVLIRAVFKENAE